MDLDRRVRNEQKWKKNFLDQLQSAYKEKQVSLGKYLTIDDVPDLKIDRSKLRVDKSNLEQLQTSNIVTYQTRYEKEQIRALLKASKKEKDINNSGVSASSSSANIDGEETTANILPNETGNLSSSLCSLCGVKCCRQSC